MNSQKGAVSPVLIFWMVLGFLAIGGIAIGMFFTGSVGGFSQAAREAYANRDAIMFLKYLMHEAGMWIAVAIAFIAIMAYFFKKPAP